MKKTLLLTSILLLSYACANKVNTDTTTKETTATTVVNNDTINMDKNIDFDRLPNAVKDSLNRFPKYEEIIAGMVFKNDGTRTKNIVQFAAIDSLLITADVYTTNPKNPYILLCHQAGYSRGEYNNTVRELLLMGYNCVALDQRSGGKVNGIINETAKRAKEKGLSTEYLDAKADIFAAIDFTYELNNKKPIIIVGSSYSATLVMLIANKNAKVKKVAAFSPGEYFQGVSIMQNLAGFDKPVYVTGTKEEVPKIKTMCKLISPSYLNVYEPKEAGTHGSKALWYSNQGYIGYWQSFKAFLKK